MTYYSRSYGGSGIGYGKSRKSYYDDDLEDYAYKRGYGNRSYGGNSYTPPKWNWGSFGGFGSFEEDDDKDLFIKSHDSYFTPKGQDFEHRFKNSLNTKVNRNLIKELSRFFYYQMIQEPDYFAEKYKDLENLSETEQSEFQHKEVFYKGLEDKFIPGISPLEKAFSVFTQLEEKKPKDRKGDPSIKPEDMDESFIQFRDELFNDPEYNELLDSTLFGKKYKFDILNKIGLIRDLGAQFKVEKEIEEKIVANSSIVAKKVMRDYSQLYNIDLYQKLMPTFDLRLLTKDLIVNVPVDRTEHKQKIIMLLDYSGSMHTDTKQQWVVAILVDRLRYVMKEEAEVFFSYFVDETDQLSFHHLYNRETAMNFMHKFSTSPSGGDTCLGDMVTHIKSEIEKGKLHNLSVDLREENPEILAINDGQDTVKTNKFTYKTNAITLVDGLNDQLKKLCVENNGKYVYVRDKSRVETYSKEGKQTLTV